MVFTQPLTWRCAICGKKRPDAKISVRSKPWEVDGTVIGEENIRYCNDDPKCAERLPGPFR